MNNNRKIYLENNVKKCTQICTNGRDRQDGDGVARIAGTVSPDDVPRPPGTGGGYAERGSGGS